MKTVNTNRLNQLWKEGVLPKIKALLDDLTESINGVDEKIDVLDTKEEIEANTDEEKMAGALAVKGMFGEINSKLGDLLIVKTVQKTISVLYLNQFYVDISAPDGYKAIGLANHAGDYRINIFSARISNNKIVFVALSTASEEVSVTLLFDVLFLKI